MLKCNDYNNVELKNFYKSPRKFNDLTNIMLSRIRDDIHIKHSSNFREWLNFLISLLNFPGFFVLVHVMECAINLAL